MCFKTETQNDQYGPTQMPTPELPTGRPASTERLTKLGKLTKVLSPVIFGGLAEGFGGRGAASQMFEQEDARDLRQRQLARQAGFDQLEMQKTQRELNAPRFPSSSPYDLLDSDGTIGVYQNDTITGQPVRRGTAPPKEKPQNDTRIDVREGNGGYFGIPTSGPNAGKASQIMTRDPAALPTPAASMDAFGTEEPQPEAPTIPLEPYRKDETEADPQAVTDTDASGVSTTHFVDKNPKSKTFGQDLTPKPVATRHPKPTAASSKPKSEDIEKYAQRALQRANGDGDIAIAKIGDSAIPDELKALIRNRIREIKRPGQPKKSSLDLLSDEEKQQFLPKR